MAASLTDGCQTNPILSQGFLMTIQAAASLQTRYSTDVNADAEQ